MDIAGSWLFLCDPVVPDVEANLEILMLKLYKFYPNIIWFPTRKLLMIPMQQLQHNRLRRRDNNNRSVLSSNHESTLLRQIYASRQLDGCVAYVGKLIQNSNRRWIHDRPSLY